MTTAAVQLVEIARQHIAQTAPQLRRQAKTEITRWSHCSACMGNTWQALVAGAWVCGCGEVQR